MFPLDSFVFFLNVFMQYQNFLSPWFHSLLSLYVIHSGNIVYTFDRNCRTKTFSLLLNSIYHIFVKCGGRVNFKFTNGLFWFSVCHFSTKIFKLQARKLHNLNLQLKFSWQRVATSNSALFSWEQCSLNSIRVL